MFSGNKINLNKINFNIIFKSCLMTSLFLAMFLFATNFALAAEVSEFVPVPEITNLENGQTISGQMTVEAISLNFSHVKVCLDDEVLGYTEDEIGPDGWQDSMIDLPSGLEFGEHKLSAVTEYFNNVQSTSTVLVFNYAEKFPGATLFNPVLNFETNFQQPWIVGLAHNDSILEIYIDEKLDGELTVKNHASGVTDFRYLPSSKLDLGFHTVKVLAKHPDGRVSDFSNEIIFEVRSGVAKAQAPDLPKEIGEFIPPVPAPTLVEPKQGSVTQDNNLVVTGLVHNEHYVKIFADDKLVGEFMPLPHESGVTSFTWQAEQGLGFGSHSVWAEAINPRGQISGQSNILRFIVLPPEHFVSQSTGKIAAASEQEPASDVDLEQGVDGVVNKINEWANWWKYFIAIVILVVIVLIVIWVLSVNKDKGNKGDKGDKGNKVDVKTEHADESRINPDSTDNDEKPVVQGPEINYSEYEPPMNDDYNENDENLPPPPPPVDSPTLGF